MQVHGVCGQEYRVLSQRFPWTVKCHVCGKHFVVLDTGKAVDAESAPVAESELLASIQSQPVLAKAGSRSAAVCDDQHIRAFAGGPHQTVSTQLQKIDKRWREYCDATAWQFCGFRLNPSPAKAIAFGIAFGVLSGIFFLILPFVFESGVEKAVDLYHDAIAFREMEAYFQKLRVEAISQQLDGDNSATR